MREDKMAGQVVLSIAASLDGRLADAAGRVSFLDPYPASDFAFDEFVAGVGAILMGRTSYDRGRELGPWPYGATPVLVLSHRPLDTELPFLKRFDGPISGAIAQLKAQTEKVIWIMGGGDVARQALDANLVDRIELAIVPELLGAGPLWRPDGVQPTFKPVRSTMHATGALSIVLERA
jgi:dihydrofolate reductase